MPRNVRPSGWYYDGNPDYKNTTVAERRQMQNTWDLLAEQEKANDLTREKIKQEKINNDNLIDAINKSNLINKKINDDNNQTLKEIEDMKLERLKLEHYYKICEAKGIDYDDIKLFLQKLQESNPNILNEINTLNKKLEDLNKTKIKTYHNKYNEYVNSYNKVLIKLKETEEELSNISIFTKLFNKKNIHTLQKKKVSLQNKVNELGDILDNYNDENSESESNNIKYEIQEINEKIKNLTKQNNEYIYHKCMNFLEFRKYHYNRDMEILFKKINITPLDNKEIIKTGSKDDYIKYIRDHII